MTMLLWFILSAGAVIFSILVLLGMVLWFIESESED